MANEQLINNRLVNIHRDDGSVSSRLGDFVQNTGSDYSKEINRNTAIDLSNPSNPNSEDIALSTVGKTAKGLSTAVSTAGKAGNTVLASGLKGFKQTFNAGSKNKNIRDIVMATIGGVFGLGAIKSLLGIPKIIADDKYREAQSPFILNLGKLITGSSLAYGLVKGVLGGTGLGLSGSIVGLAFFAIFNVLSSLYEKPDGRASKIASAIGLRQQVVDLLDVLKIGKLFK